MKANSKQEQHAGGKRIADMPLRHMLKNRNRKHFPWGGGRIKNIISVDSSAKNILKQLAESSSAAANNIDSESASDAAFGHLQKILTETGSILPMQQGVVDENALCAVEPFLGDDCIPDIFPFEHHLLIAYISSCQQENRMIYVSPQASNIGFAPEAWHGNVDLRLQQVHKDDLEQLVSAIQHSRSTGKNLNCYYRLYDSCGKVRWFHDEASVLCDESGTPMFIFGAMLDITDKREMEAELKVHRYYLEQGVEQRTEQLLKRMALLESCNATLGEKLALAQKELAKLKQQPDTNLSLVAQTTPTPTSASGAQSNESVEQLDGIGFWAHKMISLTLDNWIKHGCYKPNKTKHFFSASQIAPPTQPPQSNTAEKNNECNEQMEAFSDWARKLIGGGGVASEAV